MSTAADYYGLCECGCGQKTIVSPRTRSSKRWIAGVPRRFIHGHNPIIPFPRRLINFWENTIYEFNGEWDCIVWNGQITCNGYGAYIPILSSKSVHQIAYKLTFGDIPEGLELDHLCRNRACVNPYHLEPVTKTVNVRRGAKCVINMDIARQMRVMPGPARLIAAHFGVSMGTVDAVRSGRTWREDV
jgi:hypothetical protein